MDKNCVTIKKINNHESKNINNGIPNNTKRLNNLKSNKYFSSQLEDSMQKALIEYYSKNRKNSLTKKNSSQENESKTTTDKKTQNKQISNKNYSAEKQNKTCQKKIFHKNNSIKLDKKILNFAEPRIKINEFYKISPKILDSSLNNSEDMSLNEFESNLIQTKKNNITDSNELTSTIENDDDEFEDIDFQKNKKISFGVEKNNTNNINKNIIVNNINIPDENENKNTDEDTSTQVCITERSTNVNKNKEIYLNINSKEIDFNDLIYKEQLYSDLIKDIEINKMELYRNKILIIKDFLDLITNDKYISSLKYLDVNQNIKNEFSENIKQAVKTHNNVNFQNISNLRIIIKEYLINEIIFFFVILIISFIKKEKEQYFSGLHNLTFYFHQNFNVYNFILVNQTNDKIMKKNKTQNKNNNNDTYSNYEKCKKLITENKTWLNLKNYKKFLLTNNKITRQILKTILEQLKTNFTTDKTLLIETDIKNKITPCINFFLKNLKIIRNINFSAFMTDLKKYPSINFLLEALNINSTKPENISPPQKITETPKIPFLNPINPKYKYTLVLDLDETLVHYIADKESAYIQIRPGAEEFIKDLSKFYEIVIFTAALQTYADLVIDGIDPENYVSGRLYRQHTINEGNASIKDLSKLGRDLKYVIIIDNFLENFSLQPKNGLKIIDFEGNENDNELDFLKEDLIRLAKLRPDDVRYFLKDIQVSMDQRASYFMQDKYLDEINNMK